MARLFSRVKTQATQDESTDGSTSTPDFDNEHVTDPARYSDEFDADDDGIADAVGDDADVSEDDEESEDAALVKDIGMRAILGEASTIVSSSGGTASGPGSTRGRKARSRGKSRKSGVKRASFDFTKLDEVAAEIAKEQDNDTGEILDTTKLTRQERKALEAAMGDTLDVYPYLMALKPRERYFFRSDYYYVDNQVACILAYFHDEAARDAFPTFWGINRIPGGLGEGVTSVVLEQISKETDSWVDDHMKTADRLDKLEAQEQADGAATMSTKRKMNKTSAEIEEVVGDLQDGDAYLRVHNRLMLKAPTVEALDLAIERVRRSYIDLFGTLQVEPYHGEQRMELSNLLMSNSKKRGKGFHYSSRQYAGSYSLVTNGLNDPNGEYVGRMIGDVNTSAVLFDVNGYAGHVVCADATLNPYMGNQRVVDMWGSKISQAALLNNHRVVHLVLNGCDLGQLGPSLDDLTARVDMSNGEVNMFEVFGNVEDEVSLFAVHLNKLVLMAQLLYGKMDQNQAIISGKLREILNEFYVDQRMWVDNAKENREKLRLVGIDHLEVPLLQVFVTYLEDAYAREARRSRDQTLISALNALSLIFRDALAANGDLFNNHTSTSIDSVNNSRRVIYEFSSLLRRGGGADSRGVAMAQLVNIVGFAVESLQRGDVVIIHGADAIRDLGVQEYLDVQFDYLRRRGGRVVYLYDSPDAMIEEQDFNKFHRADYTIIGPMSLDTVDAYQVALRENIPPDLQRLVLNQDLFLSYLRRGVSNVVFQTDIPLGLRSGSYHRDIKAARVQAKGMDRGVGFNSRYGVSRKRSGDAHQLTKQRHSPKRAQDHDPSQSEAVETAPDSTVSADQDTVQDTAMVQ